ncbi:MAG: fused MFS/spermidine synthase [Pirellulales bacterium]|nr:fused MFS/spermidine synthase [Pirellulales bacterium]
MNRHRRRFSAVVLLFFLASGTTGLVLEVVWTRILGTVFGNTVYAASTVLTAYMLGLALGAAVLGRVADRSRRPLALYGALEVGVGLYALVFPLLAAAACAVYAWHYRTFQPGFAAFGAVRFLLSLLMLLPPTFLMGGTLPVLGRYLGTEHREPGQAVGYLYGANTIGAVAGCFLAGFVLLEWLGVRGSLIAAGSTALLVGLLAMGLGRRRETIEEPVAGPPPTVAEASHNQPLSDAAFRCVMVAFAVTGFCSLACEVLWTRVLIFVLLTSVYSFAAMLTVFLAGIAVGSFVSARFFVPRLRRPLLWFGVIELLVGLSILGSVPLLAQLEWIDYHLLQRFGWSGRWQAVLAHFADAAVVLLAPTLLMGAAFPIVTACCLSGKVPVGRRVGQVYAANTIGCVLGSFAAGFVLLPLLGTHQSLLTVVALNLAVGVALVWQAGGPSLAARSGLALPAAALAVAAFLLTPSDVFHRTINAYNSPSEIVLLREHPTGTVVVHDMPNEERILSVSGVTVAGNDFMLRTTQKLQGYIPLCLHSDPKRVVQIGFGSGETTRVGIEFGVQDYTVVEICPVVFDAGDYFRELNRGSHRDPRVRRIIMDGKNFARLSAKKFDVVMNDSVYPGTSGSSALYTIDHFRHCRRRLAEGGLFSCWVPLDLRPAELRMILRSFQEVFPHTSFWVASNCLNKHGLILGSLEPLRIDFARLDAVMRRPEVAADLAAIAVEDAFDLLDCHMCDEAAIRRLVQDSPVNSDDRPRLEFSCANPVSEDGALPYVLGMLLRGRAPIAPCVDGFQDPRSDRAELMRRFEATTHVFQAQLAQLMGDAGQRERQLELARSVNPGEVHVETCEAELRREIRDFRAALAARPSNHVLALRLADRLLMASHQREAGHLYEQLVAVRPPPMPTVFVRLGEIRFRLGETDDAVRVLQQCLEFWPDSADAHDRLAGIHWRQGNPRLARTHIDEAVRLAPENPQYQAHREQIVARH